MKKHIISILITLLFLIPSAWANGGPTIYGSTAPFSFSLLPESDNTYDIGSSSLEWRTGYYGTGLVLTSTDTSSHDAISITPASNLGSSAVYRGLFIDGAALDPSAGDAEIYSLKVDFSGVSLGNEPIMNAIDVVMPATYSGQSAMAAFKATGNGTTIEILDNDQTQSAIHIDNGRIHVDTTAPAGAGRHIESFETVLAVDDLDATSIIHAFEVSITGSTSGEVSALGTHPGVGPIHQHVGTFGDMDWGGTFTGSAFADKTNEFNTSGSPTATLTAALSDYFLIADVAKFGNIQINLLALSDKDQFLIFHYGDGSQLWVEFFPEDTTDGLRSDGNIMWDADGLATWGTNTVNEITGLTGSTPYYWIKITRTRVGGINTDPTETQLQILLPTEYGWDENGALSVSSIDSGSGAIVTTGAITGAIGIITPGAAIDLSAAQSYGYAVIMSTAGDVELADVCDSATGANVTVFVRDVSETVSIAVNDSADTIIFPGLSLGADDELDSAGNAGDFVALICLEANKWYVQGYSGAWTDGGPAD